MKKTIFCSTHLSDVHARIDRTNTVFLDSSMHNDVGNHSYLALRAYDIRTPYGSSLKEVLDSVDSETYEDPLEGAYFGYISYDYGLKMKVMDSVHEIYEPAFVMSRFDIVMTEDIKNSEITIHCFGNTDDMDAEMDYAEKLIRTSSVGNMPSAKGYRVKTLTSGPEFQDAVKKAIELMVAGEYYVINITHMITVESDTDPFDAFSRLRNISPSPFGAYIDICGTQIISSSMELLLEISGNNVYTRPIKGTMPRYDSEEEDRKSLENLLHSDKDRSELLMITDLERNDLNLSCKPGTVRVNRFFSPEEYSTVFHTVSDVSGVLRDGISLYETAENIFPGGSITGAPKIACMKSVDVLEKTNRGIYTGSICMFSSERTVMNIAIRTMVHKNGVYTMGVGGGITVESDPEAEYRETMQKAVAMLKALGESDDT